jgi:hypothetical protein
MLYLRVLLHMLCLDQHLLVTLNFLEQLLHKVVSVIDFHLKGFFP